jgi:hypothetical protein
MAVSRQEVNDEVIYLRSAGVACQQHGTTVSGFLPRAVERHSLW